VAKSQDVEGWTEPVSGVEMAKPFPQGKEERQGECRASAASTS